MQNVIKKHDSCVRVLKFLKLLLENDISIKDISQTTYDSLDNIEAPETFLKYIYTLEVSGFDISKIGKKYSIRSVLSKIDYTEEDVDLLEEIYRNFDFCCIEKFREDFNNLIDNLSKTTKDINKAERLKSIISINNKRKDITNETSSQNALKYQKYIDIGQKLKIIYKGESIVVEPQEVEVENNKIYFEVHNVYKSCKMRLLTDDIENIEILPNKNNTFNITGTIVFEVYDRLAVNYRLRENEHIQTYSENSKVIVNCGEDRKELIKRLLKYGENCKIISPKYFQDEFLKELSLIKDKLQGVLK